MSLPSSSSAPAWYIRNQATHQRFTEANFATQREAETEIAKVLTEAKKKTGPSPCLEAVQLLVE